METRDEDTGNHATCPSSGCVHVAQSTEETVDLIWPVRMRMMMMPKIRLADCLHVERVCRIGRGRKTGCAMSLIRWWCGVEFWNLLGPSIHMSPERHFPLTRPLWGKLVPVPGPCISARAPLPSYLVPQLATCGIRYTPCSWMLMLITLLICLAAESNMFGHT
jgi:hypothetical protein